MEDLSFSNYKLLTGDALVLLRTLPDESVQTITTSPPYYTLRDYGTDSQAWGGDRLLRCSTCGVIIQDHEANQRQGEESVPRLRGRNGKKSKALLQVRDKKAQKAQTNLRDVRGQSSQSRKQESVQSKVRGQPGDQGRSVAHSPERMGKGKPQLEGRAATNNRGLHSSFGATGSPLPGKEPLHDGAPYCDGETPRQAPSSTREGSSSQRSKERQQDRELAGGNASFSLRGDRVSSLSGTLPCTLSGEHQWQPHECDHDWGEEIPGDSRGGTGPGAKETRTADVKSAYGRDAARGSFCQKCDAWFGELGLEPTPELFVEHLVLIFREARRVLRKDGTLFLNIADTYSSATSNKAGSAKPKDLLGIPWAVARALRDDGWWLRNDAIWSKAGGNCPKCHFRVEKGSGMPEPVKDRFVRAHEYVFLLAKSRKYYFDDEAVKQPFSNAKRRDVFYIPSQSFRGAHYAVMPSTLANLLISAGSSEHGACSKCAAPYKRVTKKGAVDSASQKKAGSNADGGYTGKNTKAYDEHGAQKPGDVKRRILAGMKKISTIGWAQTCKCKDVGDPVKCLVMDPFSGSGTTGAAALEHGSRYLGLELFEENNRDIAGPRLAKIVNKDAPPTVSYLPSTSDIYHGDAYKLLARVTPASVRLILADPPYNVSRKNNFQTMGRTGVDFSWDSDFDQEKWLYLADKALKPGGSIVVWNDWKNLGRVARSLEDLGYSVKRNIIWEKSNPWPRNRDRSFVQRIETGLWAVKSGAKWVFNRDKSKSFEDGIFRYGVPRAKKDRPRHEAKKPDNMFIELIKILSNEGEIILDPFCGGGTTAYAAEKSGRIHISFERDKAWVKEAKAHLADAQPKVSPRA